MKKSKYSIVLFILSFLFCSTANAQIKTISVKHQLKKVQKVEYKVATKAQKKTDRTLVLRSPQKAAQRKKGSAIVPPRHLKLPKKQK